MTWLSMMYVVIGGAFGSLCRYLTMSAVTRVNPGTFPWGTFTVNIIGGFIMGAWVASIAYMTPTRSKDLHLLFAVGVLGGFTTFSTFSLDLFFLLERGLWMQVILYATGSVMLSVAALVAGMWVVRMIA